MKIIEAMKKQKELMVKAEDLRKKIGTYCADNSHETATYGAEQKTKIKEWLQGHSDVLKEILKLRIAIQRTNLQTDVTIELGGKQVTKCIAEWIHRRKELAGLELQSWQVLTDRNLKEGAIKSSTGEITQVTIRRYYDPSERDQSVELFRTEPGVIDRTLEVTNAITEVLEGA